MFPADIAPITHDTVSVGALVYRVSVTALGALGVHPAAAPHKCLIASSNILYNIATENQWYVTATSGWLNIHLFWNKA